MMAERFSAVFLDRDGVINENRVDHVKNWDEFEFLPGACETIARFTQAGLRVFVVSNQAIVNRGIVSADEVEAIHQGMVDEIERAGGRVDGIAYCPHRPDEKCACRKPQPGLLRMLAENHDVDLGSALFVGDVMSDLDAGHAAGCATILVLTGRGRDQVAQACAAGREDVLVYADLPQVADLVLNRSGHTACASGDGLNPFSIPVEAGPLSTSSPILDRLPSSALEIQGPEGPATDLEMHMLELAPLKATTLTAGLVQAAKAKTVRTRAMDYLADLAGVLALVPGEALGQAIALLLEARATGKRVYVMGNGGSSATASHFVCDLVKTARVKGFDPIKAFALTDNTPLLTAWANDSAFEDSFAEQVNALAEPDDVVIGISASGNSPNIIAGLLAASERGARTIALVGFDGGRAHHVSDVSIHIQSHHYGLVEDTHSALTHAMAAAVKDALETEAKIAEFAVR
ncbi:MAG: hypothetical protein NVSMB2_06260 [Chloroflexota bacterium]